jgi:threonyl-tRNA synthetase
VFLRFQRKDFKLRPVSKTEALELYKDNVYKTEMITNLEDGITFCDHDTFTDLCRGGHIPNTGIIKAENHECVGATGVVTKNKTVDSCIWNSSKTKELTEYLPTEGSETSRSQKTRERIRVVCSAKVVRPSFVVTKGAALRERLEQFLKKAEKPVEQVIHHLLVRKNFMYSVDIQNISRQFSTYKHSTKVKSF